MGLGMQEMIVIFLIVLLLFGAKRIPDLARGIGKGMGEFSKAKKEFERELQVGEVEGRKGRDANPGPLPAAPAPFGASAPASET